MPNLRHAVSGLAASALLLATPAFADWEADLLMKPRAGAMGDNSVRELHGKAHGRQTSMRMDIEAPREPMSMIVNWEKHQMMMLMHSQKIVMQRDMTQDSDIPSCGSKDMDTCLVSQGFKKTGSETINGHPCTVYEKEMKSHKGPFTMKVWRPTDLKEVPFLRNQSSDANGVVGQMDLMNVKLGAQPDSLFAAPSDYRPMQMPAGGAPGARPGGAPPAMNPADFQGKTPEQIREMIQQRMGQTGAPPAGK